MALGTAIRSSGPLISCDRQFISKKGVTFALGGFFALHGGVIVRARSPSNRLASRFSIALAVESIYSYLLLQYTAAFW